MTTKQGINNAKESKLVFLDNLQVSFENVYKDHVCRHKFCLVCRAVLHSA